MGFPKLGYPQESSILCKLLPGINHPAIKGYPINQSFPYEIYKYHTISHSIRTNDVKQSPLNRKPPSGGWFTKKMENPIKHG